MSDERQSHEWAVGMERLRLESGDLLLVTLDAHTDPNLIHSIHRALTEAFEAQGLLVTILFKSPALGVEAIHCRPGDLLIVSSATPLDPEAWSTIERSAPLPVLFRPAGCRLDKMDIVQMNAANWWHGDQLGRVPEPEVPGGHANAG